MSENKRYLLRYNEYESSNGEIIQAEPYFIDTEEEYVDDDYFTIDGYPTMSDKQVVDLLNEQNDKIQKCKLAYNQLTSYVDANFDEYMTQKRLNERIKELEREIHVKTDIIQQQRNELNKDPYRSVHKYRKKWLSVSEELIEAYGIIKKLKLKYGDMND